MCAVSIIIPTLNEAENIDYLLERVFQVKRSFSLDFDVLFVDSASSDATCEKVAAWQEREDVSILKRQTDDGLAKAVVAAAGIARGEFVVVMDADLSHPPELLPELIEPLLDGSWDMVIGSRYITGGSTPDWALSRKIGSKLATIPAQLFTHVKDPLAGFFAVERSRLQSLTGSIRGFKIGLEILAAGGSELRVKEVPIEFCERSYGVSKMSRGVVMDYLMQLLVLAKKRASSG
jgi:dolichol-phosphate mannosyltransferase